MDPIGKYSFNLEVCREYFNQLYSNSNSIIKEGYNPKLFQIGH